MIEAELILEGMFYVLFLFINWECEGEFIVNPYYWDEARPAFIFLSIIVALIIIISICSGCHFAIQMDYRCNCRRF